MTVTSRGEPPPDELMGASPKHGVELGGDAVADAFFHQLEIEVPALAPAHALDFARHPHRTVGLGEEAADILSELRDAVGLRIEISDK